MGYIPANAKWYLAEIVQQISVEDDPRIVVHANVVLIRADSPDDAYEKAVLLGAGKQTSYENPHGKRVTFTFRGLRDLNVIHDELEHGAELSYTEFTDMDEAAIQHYISPREELGVFTAIESPGGPNYASKEVIDKLLEKFPGLDLGEGW